MSFRDRVFRDPQLFRRVMSLYPPYLGAGIRVRSVSADFREVVVSLTLNRFNKNAFGTQFGGSLYAMTDPFYALMFVANLGRDYVVWDKSARIAFERPGTGPVTARFVLTDADLAAARAGTEHGERYTPTYEVEVLGENGKRVARVEKELYLHRRGAGPETKATV